MRIGFVLPGVPMSQSGGGKVIYRYASYLARNGNDVIIYFFCAKTLVKRNLPERIRKSICKAVVKVGTGKEDLDRRVKRKAIFEINNNAIKDGEIIFATAYHTSKPVYRLSKEKGEKWYFIQDHEIWGRDEREVTDAYGLMRNIVTAKWLKGLVDSYSSFESLYLPIGVDTKIFKINKKIESRSDFVLGALYNEQKHKGFQYTYEAILKLKVKYPELKVVLFGRGKMKRTLPEWISYHRDPGIKDLVNLYNQISIFICSSIKEGFGMTGAESMACGCALCSTSYEGVLEYAKHGVNAFLSEPENVHEMVVNVSALIDNHKKRVEIAYSGYNAISKMKWEKSYDIFENCIMKGKQEWNISKD